MVSFSVLTIAFSQGLISGIVCCWRQHGLQCCEDALFISPDQHITEIIHSHTDKGRVVSESMGSLLSIHRQPVAAPTTEEEFITRKRVPEEFLDRRERCVLFVAVPDLRVAHHSSTTASHHKEINSRTKYLRITAKNCWCWNKHKKICVCLAGVGVTTCDRTEY